MGRMQFASNRFVVSRSTIERCGGFNVKIHSTVQQTALKGSKDAELGENVVRTELANN
jgi:hypothetical protein